MKNLDTRLENKNAILQRITDALKGEDTEETAKSFGEAMDDLCDFVKSEVVGEYSGLLNTQDNLVLAARGARTLTSEEKKVYDDFISKAKAADAKSALTNIDIVLPKTVVDSIFDDIQAAHPLLDVINFQNTEALTEIYVSTTSGAAVWGELTAAITGELSTSFTKIDLAKSKLTAFMLIPKAMLDLGPVWLDRYVRAELAEALAVQLETSAVDGDGKDQMIGMTRKLSGATDGVYPRKTAVAVTAFDPTNYSGVLDTLSQGPNSKRRAIASVLLVVNPADYFTKVFPATTVRATDGTWNHDVFPFPTTVVQSTAVPAGFAVMGLPTRYFAGLGSAGKGGKLEYDDSVKFMEDQRAYAIRLYGDGRALDENAFVYLDISGVKPTIQQVTVAGTVTTKASA